MVDFLKKKKIALTHSQTLGRVLEPCGSREGRIEGARRIKDTKRKTTESTNLGPERPTEAERHQPEIMRITVMQLSFLWDS